MTQHRRLSLTLLASLAVSTVAVAAPPTSGNDAYQAAKDAEARLDYKIVYAQAKKALGAANPHDHLVELYQMLGTAAGVLGKNDEAVDAFTKLLAVDPDHRLPRGLSPKITRPFQEAGGYWIDRPGGLSVAPDLPREVPGSKPLVIAVKLQDPLKMTDVVRLSYRREGTVEYVNLEAQANNEMSLSLPGLSFTIPADAIPALKSDYNLELFVTALSPAGSELRQAGDPQRPLTIVVRAMKDVTPVVVVGGNDQQLVAKPKKQTPAILKKWWFWTAVGGVVAVGVGLGAGLGAYYSRDTAHVDVNVSSK